MNERPAPPTEPPIHESVRTKRRWGCACGCLVFILLILFGVAGGTLYFLRPVPPAARESFLPDGAVGFGVIRLNAEDQGVSEMRDRLLRKAEAASKDANAGSSGNTSRGVWFFRQFGSVVLPVVPEIVVGVAPAKDGEAGLRAVTSLRMGNRLGMVVSRIVVNGIQGGTRDDRGKTLQVNLKSGTKPGASVGHAGSAVVIGSDAEIVAPTLERALGEKPQATPAANLQSYLDQLQLGSPPEGEDLAFAFVNAPGRMRELMGWLGKALKEPKFQPKLDEAMAAAGVSFDDADGMTITGDVKDASTIRLDIKIFFQQSEKAKKAAELLKTSLAQAIQAGAEAGSKLKFRSDTTASGPVVQVTLTFSGIMDWWQEILAGPKPPSGPPSGGPLPAPPVPVAESTPAAAAPAPAAEAPAGAPALPVPPGPPGARP